MAAHDMRFMRAFSISAGELEVLGKAARGQRLDGPGDGAACLALWRAGLLRVNGESGFQLSQLGVAAVRAQRAIDDPASRPDDVTSARRESGRTPPSRMSSAADPAFSGKRNEVTSSSVENRSVAASPHPPPSAR